MEAFLINQNLPMVIVSHDREFLDKVRESSLLTTYWSESILSS